MAKQDFGEPVGTCNICGINLWSSCNGLPAIFPCGVASCPYETPEEQMRNNSKIIEMSESGSQLLQLMQET